MSTTEKLILRRQRYRANDNQYRVRVSGTCYEMLEKLSEQTNQSLTEIASKMLEWAAARVEV